MKFLLFTMLLMSSMSYAQNSSPVVDPDKFTICAITINSDDEKKLFEAEAAKNPKKFNPVVELTTMGENDWFQKACSSNLRCDQLVISGHYAGGFFSEGGGKHLSPEELEEAGCSKTCEGILGNPYEVFLFGCNTLASKDEDQRTPAQYLQVLLRDGIPLSQAEMIVETRYSSLGDSNKATMQRAFGGQQKQIYGFDSIGPSGKNVKGFLKNYFSKINTTDRMEKLQAKRMLNQVENANKALSDSLKLTTFTECNQANPQDEKTQRICTFSNNKVSDDEKLALALELLTRDDYLTYLPVISRYLKKLNVENLTKSQKDALALIKGNEIIKNQILALYQKASGLGLTMEWGDLAYNLGFLDKDEARDKVKTAIKKMLSKPLTANDLDTICNLELTGPYQDIKFTEDDITNKKVGKFEIYATECLEMNDPRTITRLLKYDVKKDKELAGTLFWMARELPEGTTLPAWMRSVADEKLKEGNFDKSSYLEFLAKFYSNDPAVGTMAKSLLKSEDSNEVYVGMKILRDHGKMDTAAVTDLVTTMSRENFTCDFCLTDLVELPKKDQPIIKYLSGELILNKYEYRKRDVFNSLIPYVKEKEVNSAMFAFIEQKPYTLTKVEWKKLFDSGVEIPQNVQKVYDRVKDYIY